MILLDAHLHIDKQTTSLPKGFIWFVNCARSDQWESVIRLAVTQNNVYGFIGVHPWRSGLAENTDKNASWYIRLRQLLIENPQLGLGEIGLDASGWHRHCLEKQRLIFCRQLQLALELRRPVSLHCVRAYQQLISDMRAVIRSTVGSPDRKNDSPGDSQYYGLIHSFNSGLGQLQALVSLGLCISFHPAIQKANSGQQALIKHCPVERLLLETDAQHGSDLPVLLQHYRWTANLLGLPLEKLADISMGNGTFYQNTVTDGTG